MSAGRAREAALLVHGLPEAAREQVLSRLSSDERGRVMPLLQELQSLGIPPLPFPADGAAEPPPAGLAARVGALDAAAVAQSLSRCAPATVAQICGAGAWPWTQAVLERLDAPRRQAVRRRDAAARLAPRTIDALLSRLLADAEAATPAAGAPAKRTLGRWLPWKR